MATKLLLTAEYRISCKGLSKLNLYLINFDVSLAIQLSSLAVEGAKGGRSRSLVIKNNVQLRAVQQVELAAKALGSGTGRCIPPEMSLKQAYNAQRTLWAELGGTKANNAHMHASRHKVAQEMFANRYSKGEIMEQLGHGEDRSPFCYIPK